MSRFFASKYLRDTKVQEKLFEKGFEKAKPLLKQFGKKGMNHSTAIRPKKNYLTNRKDMDGSGLLSDMVYGFNYAPWTNQARNRHPQRSTSTKRSGNFRNPRVDSLCRGIDTLALTIPWISSCGLILRLEKFLNTT